MIRAEFNAIQGSAKSQDAEKTLDVTFVIYVTVPRRGLMEPYLLVTVSRQYIVL